MTHWSGRRESSWQSCHSLSATFIYTRQTQLKLTSTYSLKLWNKLSHSVPQLYVFLVQSHVNFLNTFKGTKVLHRGGSLDLRGELLSKQTTAPGVGGAGTGVNWRLQVTRQLIAAQVKKKKETNKTWRKWLWLSSYCTTGVVIVCLTSPGLWAVCLPAARMW